MAQPSLITAATLGPIYYCTISVLLTGHCQRNIVHAIAVVEGYLTYCNLFGKLSLTRSAGRKNLGCCHGGGIDGSGNGNNVAYCVCEIIPRREGICERIQFHELVEGF